MMRGMFENNRCLSRDFVEVLFPSFFVFTLVLVIYHHNQNKSYMNKPESWLVFKAADQGRLYEKMFYL